MEHLAQCLRHSRVQWIHGNDEEGQLEEEEARRFLHHFAAGCGQISEQLMSQRL